MSLHYEIMHNMNGISQILAPIISTFINLYNIIYIPQTNKWIALWYE